MEKLRGGAQGFSDYVFEALHKTAVDVNADAGNLTVSWHGSADDLEAGMFVPEIEFRVRKVGETEAREAREAADE
jgi:hypothetical protein